MPYKRSNLHKPSGYAGFLLSFEPQRTERIESALRIYGEAAESFSAVDWEFERREVVFLVRQHEHPSIFAAVLMQRMCDSQPTDKYTYLGFYDGTRRFEVDARVVPRASVRLYPQICGSNENFPEETEEGQYQRKHRYDEQDSDRNGDIEVEKIP